MAQAWVGASDGACGLNISCQEKRVKDAGRVVKLAEKNDLKIIIRAFTNSTYKKPVSMPTPGNMPDPNLSLVESSSPALWGYCMWDEPGGADEFKRLAEWSAAIAAARPGKLRYINLLPGTEKRNLATAQQYGYDNYSQYLDSYVQLNSKPDLLCEDNCKCIRSFCAFFRSLKKLCTDPHFELTDDDPVHSGTRDDYRANLAALRTRALRIGVPFWNCVQERWLCSTPFSADFARCCHRFQRHSVRR